MQLYTLLGFTYPIRAMPFPCTDYSVLLASSYDLWLVSCWSLSTACPDFWLASWLFMSNAFPDLQLVSWLPISAACPGLLLVSGVSMSAACPDLWFVSWMSLSAAWTDLLTFLKKNALHCPYTTDTSHACWCKQSLIESFHTDCDKTALLV